MPKKNQKAFQVILAIVIALGLWLYVIGVENPAGTAHIRDVPIQLQGEQTLEDSGLMVTDLSRDGISVSLNGKKKTLMKISRKNLSLILDVSSVTEAGTCTLTGRLSYPVHDSLAALGKENADSQSTGDGCADLFIKTEDGIET